MMVRAERVRGAGLAVVLCAAALAGCSGSVVEGPPSGSSSFRDRMSNLFFGTPGAEAQASAVNMADPNQDCPVADIRGGASTLQFNTGKETSGSTLRYQATIARLARECAVRGSTMTVKVGVQGRIALGPAGGPGQIDVPLRYAVVQEGPEPRTILTKLYRFPVTIAEGQSNVPFLHVEEDITFNIPSRLQLENYVVYVGFDPGAAKEPAPAKTRRPR